MRRQGDDRKFPGGRAAERLKQFELERGLGGPDPAEPERPDAGPTPPGGEGCADEE